MTRSEFDKIILMHLCIMYILDEERHFQFMDEAGNTYDVSMYHDKKKYETAVKYCGKKGMQSVLPTTEGAYQMREVGWRCFLLESESI